MRELFKIEDTDHPFWLSVSDNGFRLHYEDRVLEVVPDRASGARQQLRVNGVLQEVFIAQRGNRLHIHFDGAVHDLTYVDPVSRFADEAFLSKSDHLRAPMPGAVVACAVKAGDQVEAGDLLMVIESMKLETPFKAWRAGSIEKVHCAMGKTFDRDAVLLSMTPVKAE